MNDVQVIEWIISLPHALQIIKKLKTKRHAALGFSYELTELNTYMYNHAVQQQVPHLFSEIGETKRIYADYGPMVEAYHLRVFRVAS